MTTIIDGKNLTKQKLDSLKAEIGSLKNKPCLAILLAGEYPASKIYVTNKAKAAAEIGIKAETINLTESIIELSLFSRIK